MNSEYKVDEEIEVKESKLDETHFEVEAVIEACIQQLTVEETKVEDESLTVAEEAKVEPETVFEQPKVEETKVEEVSLEESKKVNTNEDSSMQQAIISSIQKLIKQCRLWMYSKYNKK